MIGILYDIATAYWTSRAASASSLGSVAMTCSFTPPLIPTLVKVASAAYGAHAALHSASWSYLAHFSRNPDTPNRLGWLGSAWYEPTLYSDRRHSGVIVSLQNATSSTCGGIAAAAAACVWSCGASTSSKIWLR